MMELYIVFGVCVVIAFFLLKYLGGDYTISIIEEIESNTYTVTNKDFTGREYGSGKLTRKVFKYTYLSGKVKFKTKEYKH